MSKKTKNWLIAAAVLILSGCVLFAGAVKMLGWEFSELSTDEYETTEHTPVGEYKNISIDTDTADIVFAPCEDENTKIVCYELKNAEHAVSIENGTLMIRVVNEKKWYDYIGIHFGSPKITLYIPQGEYGDLTVNSETGAVQLPKEFAFGSMDIRLSTGIVKSCASVSGDMKIKTTTGSITLEKVSAGSVQLAASTGRIIGSDIDCKGDMTVKVSTGKTGLTNVKCQNFTSTGNTGDLTMENVIASGAFSIERDTGDVDFESCDAAEITVTTDTGHIKGSFLSEKVFITETDTGRVEVPHTTSGGKCQLTTDTGNIKIKITQ